MSVCMTEAGSTAGPMLRVLGPVTLEGCQGVSPSTHAGVCTELLAYLALVPDPSGEALTDALWPLRSTNGAATRHAAVSRARRWLGVDPTTGEPYLPRDALRLHGVQTDWDRFCRLAPDSPELASTDALAQALSLVRGRPLDGTAGRTMAGTRRRSAPYGYAWAECLRQEMCSRILDAAQVLAARHLGEGQWAAAEEIAALGLSIHPGIESLWRARIIAAFGAHNRRAIDEAIERLEVIVQRDFGDDLEPATNVLIRTINSSRQGNGDVAQLLPLVG